MELGRRWRWAALPTLLAMSAAQKSCPAGEKTLSMRLATAGVSARECLFDPLAPCSVNSISFAWVHDEAWMRTSNRRHLSVTLPCGQFWKMPRNAPRRIIVCFASTRSWAHASHISSIGVTV
jgi:hypothetical protein